MPDHTGHHHYEVCIGAGSKDTIEVIYNEQFGAVPFNGITYGVSKTAQ